MTASEQTFAFADLAGYTALTEAHGDEQAADTAAEFFATIRALLADHDAEEVNAVAMRTRDGVNHFFCSARCAETFDARS